MRRLLFILSFLAPALWSSPCLAQARNQLGPLCTTDTTPADQQIDACNKIIALKVFKGEQLATVYFWRAVGWNKKGDYTKVIADATEAIRLQPSQAVYNLRGSAYFDKGEYDISIADFDDSLKLGPPSGIIFHNRGNAYQGKKDYAKAIADFDAAIKADPKSAFSYQNRGNCKEALGDLDGALADINQAIRLDPTLSQPLVHRTTIWRAKGELDRAIADGTEAIRLAKDKPPVNIMTPPNSVLISAYTFRGLAYEARGDYEHAKADYKGALSVTASDAGSKSNQATAKVRLSLLSDATVPAPRDAPTSTAQQTPPAQQQESTAAAPAPSPAPAAPSQRMALVIGNGGYAHVKALPNPPNDARAVAKSLRDIGFTVSEGIDLDRAAMQKTTRDFLREGGAGAGGGGLLRRPWRADRRPQLSDPRRRRAQARRPRDGGDDRHGHDHGRPRRPGPHQHPDLRCLPQQPDGTAGGQRRRQSRHRGRFGSRCADEPGGRRDVRRRHADRVRHRPRSGCPRRRRRQQPILRRAVAPHRHAGAGGAADADAGARRGRLDHEEQAGAVVELVALGRGLSGGEVTAR
jgi:tetratricopeptide (TPR) repeat protein